MEKIFSNSEEKFVKNVIVYGNANKAYYDAGHKDQIPAAELLNMCRKGNVLVAYNNAFYFPVAFKEANHVVTVSIYDVLTGSAAKVDFASK